MSNLIKNLLIALGITVVVVLIYFYMSGSSEEADTGELNSEIALKTEKILADTQEINNYKLDASIFDDARFRTLKDFRIELVDVTAGRPNPFEPVQ